MFYCPKCLNIYNITKSIKTQSGGNKTLIDIITKLLNNEDIDDKIKFSQDDIDELNHIQEYKKLTNKQKDYIYNFINEKITKKISNDKTNTPKNMYFICKNCGNTELIKESTMICSRENNINNISNDSNFNVKEYLHMKILPRTRQYNCPNNNCKSHNSVTEKSAIFMRLNNSYKIRYICESCETTWLVS